MRALFVIVGLVELVLAGSAGAQVVVSRPAEPVIDVSAGAVGIAPGIAGQPPRDNSRLREGTSSIRGRVLDAQTGAPVRRALVRLSAMGAPNGRLTTTDGDGRFAFVQLPAGRYSLFATLSGYVNWSYGQRRPNAPGGTIALGERETFDRADFSIPRGAVIVGRVLDEFGEPLPDVMVSPLRYQYTVTGRQAVNAGRTAMTNDIGEFRSFGLAPGDYLLSASVQRMMAFGPSEISDERTGYAPTFYPGTADPASAQAVRVGPAQTLNGLTIVLLPTRTARVSGVVVDADGAPLRGGFISAAPQGGPRMFTGQGGPIQGDGTFTIASMTPGTYTLRAQTQGAVMPGGRGPSFTAFPVATVEVDGADIDGVRVAPPTPIRLRAHVTFDPPPASDREATSLRLTAVPLNPTEGIGPQARPSETTRNDDGTFTVEGMPGRVVVRALGLPQGWMIRRVMRKGEDVTDSMDLAADDSDELEIEITGRVASLSGRVSDSRGDAAPNVVVIVFPDDKSARGGPSRSSISRPDEQGRYTLRALLPGEYYAAAVDQVENGQWFDAEFLQSLRASATRVTLGGNETRTLDLRLVEPR